MVFSFISYLKIVTAILAAYQIFKKLTQHNRNSFAAYTLHKTSADKTQFKFKPKFKNNRGVVALEFAGSLPLLILMVFGVIEVGSAIDQYKTMSNVADNISRTAFTYNYTGSDQCYTTNGACPVTPKTPTETANSPVQSSLNQLSSYTGSYIRIKDKGGTAVTKLTGTTTNKTVEVVAPLRFNFTIGSSFNIRVIRDI